ncbi:transposase [Halomonas urmiana]|nr:transposase [Halomonas urmiana]
MSLGKVMPVLAVSRQLEISDKRLWRIVHHYVGRMLGQLDLSEVEAVGLDETASRRGQRYVTVFLDMQRQQEPVIFAVPGHGKATIAAFSAFLAEHKRGRGGLRHVAAAEADLMSHCAELPAAQAFSGE